MIEAYVETEPPTGMDWSDVGATILRVSRAAWTPMLKTIDRISPGPNTQAEGSHRQ